MALRQQGRLFMRGHNDCFIHATTSWLNYSAFSLTEDMLMVVRMTYFVNDQEQTLLATLCPASIPYENVRKGVNHRKYLEIDSKFASELGIKPDTAVVLESVREVEHCHRLVLAPVIPTDFEKLFNNQEKIEYELTERIRVVSCASFFTFPIWINNITVSVKVVRTEPSANWVLIKPELTQIELSGQVHLHSSTTYSPARDPDCKSIASTESSVDPESDSETYNMSPFTSFISGAFKKFLPLLTQATPFATPHDDGGGMTHTSIMPRKRSSSSSAIIDPVPTFHRRSKSWEASDFRVSSSSGTAKGEKHVYQPKVSNEKIKEKTNKNTGPSLQNLTVLKWRDKYGQTQILRVIETVSYRWRELGAVTGLSGSHLQSLSVQHREDSLLCCQDVFIHWLDSPPPNYPVTWEGLCELLEDLQFPLVAETVRQYLEDRHERAKPLHTGSLQVKRTECLKQVKSLRYRLNAIDFDNSSSLQVNKWMKEVKYLCQRLVENVDTLEKYVDTGEAKDEYNVDMEIDEEFAIRWKSIKKAERPIAVVTALPKKQRSGYQDSPHNTSESLAKSATVQTTQIVQEKVDHELSAPNKSQEIPFTSVSKDVASTTEHPVDTDVVSSPFPLLILKGVHFAHTGYFTYTTSEAQSSSGKTFSWAEHGLKLTVAPGTIDSHSVCTFTVGVTCTSGSFQFPPDVEPVSAMYYIKPSVKLLKPVTLEIEHCCSLQSEEDAQSLVAMLAYTTSQTPPYKFEYLKGGEFPVINAWGSISVSSFTVYGFFRRVLENSGLIAPSVYHAKVCCRQQITKVLYKLGIAMCRNLSQCKVVVKEECFLLTDGWMPVTEFDFQFNGENNRNLSLVMPEGYDDNGWKITASAPSSEVVENELDQVSQHNIDSGEYAWCELSLKWTKQDQGPCMLSQIIKMKGVTRQYFEIAVDPTSLWQHRHVPTTSIPHHKVCQYLQTMTNEQIRLLGGALGLEQHNLQRMNSLPSNMVAAWLRKEDNVLETSGPPSWGGLVQALQNIGQNGIATTIKDEELSQIVV